MRFDDLSDKLGEWHRWANGYQVVAGHGVCAMFAHTRSSRQWDDSSELADAALHNSEMKALDFHIGELETLHRVAIRILARNISTGVYSWTSALLPKNVQDRVALIADARAALIKRIGL